MPYDPDLIREIRRRIEDSVSDEDLQKVAGGVDSLFKPGEMSHRMLQQVIYMKRQLIMNGGDGEKKRRDWVLNEGATAFSKWYDDRYKLATQQ